MSPRPEPRRRNAADPNPAWSLGRLRLLAGGLATAAAVGLAGLGLAVHHALQPTPTDRTTPPTTSAGSTGGTGGSGSTGGTGVDQGLPPVGAVRDAAAAAAMPTPPTDPTGSLPAGSGAATLPTGWPTVLRGPGGVAAGYPHSPEGAVAQLAAIDEFVLTAMQPALARATYRAWALPGSPDADAWLISRHVDSFTATLARAGYGSAVVTARPVAGQVKAVDGPDWVVACVLLDVRATVKTEARLGFGHCERLQWAEGRWQIGPGTPPAQPAPVTPGSQAAAAAGWRTFTTTP